MYVYTYTHIYIYIYLWHNIYISDVYIHIHIKDLGFSLGWELLKTAGSQKGPGNCRDYKRMMGPR